MVNRICKQCKNNFYVRCKSEKNKFCSRKCFSKSIIGHKAWNNGLKGWLTKSHLRKISIASSKANKGKNHRCYGNKTWYINPVTGKQWTFKGVITATNGYISIYKPKHPKADSRGYVYQHRFFMEEKIGRFLEKNEIVHHKNHNKHDNRIENLELMTKAQHNHLHHFGIPKPRKSISCKH